MKEKEIKKIETLYREAANDNYLGVLGLEKAQFELTIDAMIIKMGEIKPTDRTNDWEEKYERLLWMKDWLNRQAHVNILQIFQAKIIKENEQEIYKLRIKLQKTLEENVQLKKRIK